MVRIIPNRLKPGFASTQNTNSLSKSRSTSPMATQGDLSSPDGLKDTGLVLKVVILRVRAARLLRLRSWNHSH
jgi:phosphatidylserine decarboxylase